MVESPQGVGDIFYRKHLLCQASYSLKVFQDFTPSNGAGSPFKPMHRLKRVEGQLTVSGTALLDPGSRYALHLVDGRRLSFSAVGRGTMGIYGILAKGQRLIGQWGLS